MYARKSIWLAGCALAFCLASNTFAANYADSIAEYSGVQGQDNWYYGFYNQGTTGGSPNGYTAAKFTEFDTFDGNSWRASVGQVGVGNNIFFNVNQFGGHPNGLDNGQTSLLWAMRRYQSEFSGLADISFDVHKLNVTEINGGGITARIFVDGVEIWSSFIENLDSVGIQATVTTSLSVGSLVDFAIDPTSANPPDGQSPFSARADGSYFSATIGNHVASVPEPSTTLMLGLGLAALLFVSTRRYRARDTVQM